MRKRIDQDRDRLAMEFPEMMKDTRLLIIDYDVTRYNSFDILSRRFSLDADGGAEGAKHFLSLKSPYLYLSDRNNTIADRVQYMMRHVPVFNPYEMFRNDLGINTPEALEKENLDLIRDKRATRTPTDVSYRFYSIFDYRHITGFFLGYKGDLYKPSFYGKVTAFEAENIMDMKLVASIVIRYRINAIMMANADWVIPLFNILKNHGYLSPITFILGCYGYNYNYDSEKNVRLGPINNEFFALMELDHHYEFGYFDPFSGLSYKRRIERNLQQNKEESNVNREEEA